MCTAQLDHEVLVDALRSDETFRYISELEQEQERLRQNIRQLSAQLQTAKVGGYMYVTLF
jgi:hypothetical protein